MNLKNEMKKKFGKKEVPISAVLRFLMKKHKMSNSQLAFCSKLCKMTIQKILADTPHKYHLETLLNLSWAFGLNDKDIDYFFYVFDRFAKKNKKPSQHVLQKASHKKTIASLQNTFDELKKSLKVLGIKVALLNLSSVIGEPQKLPYSFQPPLYKNPYVQNRLQTR